MPDKSDMLKNCPFLSVPLPGCKVQVITSQTIPQIIDCCGGKFKECPLYLNELACSNYPVPNPI